MNPARFSLAAAMLAGCVCAVWTASAQTPAPPGYHLDATWKIGGEGGWDYLAIDPAAHRLYVTRTDRVQVIDTQTGKLAGEVPGLDGGHGTALAPDLGRGFATSGKSNTVVVFDLQTLKPIGEPIPVGKKPDAIVYCQGKWTTSDGPREITVQKVFAFNGESQDATVIDAPTGKVIATVPLGGAPEFAVAADGQEVHVNLEDKSEIVTIHALTNALSSDPGVPLAPGEEPTGLSRGPGDLLLAGCHNQQMILTSPGGKQFGSVPIGKGVDAVAFDPGTGLMFASCGDGTLTVARYDQTDGFHVVEVVKTQVGARTMALDPSTHAVYLATADFEPAPPEVPGQGHTRPKPVPGSFVILKFVR